MNDRTSDGSRVQPDRAGGNMKPDTSPGSRSERKDTEKTKNQSLRCRIFDRIRRFFRPNFLRPFPVFFVPTLKLPGASNVVWRLINIKKFPTVKRSRMKSDSFGEHINPSPALIEMHESFHEGKNRIIVSKSNALSRTELRPHLSDDNAARFCDLSAEKFHTASLSVGIPTISAGSLSLFMSHKNFLPPL